MLLAFCVCQQCFSKWQDGWNCYMLLLRIFFEGDKLDWMFVHAVTDSMEQNPSWEAFTVSQLVKKFPNVYENPLFSYPWSDIVLPSKYQFHIRTCVHSFYILSFQYMCFTMKVCYCIQEPPTQEEKGCYLKKAAEFGESLAASFEDPDACHLTVQHLNHQVVSFHRST